ncbi:PH domain-containing protein [Arthrobacter rhombi]|uniref:PH domain-containing protein n=1 Tax=Arthrobacter rhombi TaxID=71253 RepID=UPI003F8F5797
MTGDQTSQPGMEESAPWRRVHPVSPMVRGWLVVVAFLYFFGQNALNNIFGSGELPPEAEKDWDFTPSVLLVIAAGIGILVVIMVGFFLSWYFTKYQVTDRHVQVNSGVVFRQQRQARIDRVQAIDIVQPLVARIFGLAELKFEVADSGSTAMRLAYIKLAAAKVLRNDILARAAGLKQEREAGPAAEGPAPEVAAEPVASVPPSPEAPERTVAVVPPPRLIAATLLSPWLAAVLLFVISMIVATVASDGQISLFYLIPGLIGVVPVLWGQFNQGYNFRAAMSEDGLRLSYGLLETSHQTVPPGRVQAVMVTQGIIWRRFGWYRVVVNVAGYGNQEGSLRSTLLPVGTRQDVLNVLSIVLPEPGTDRPSELVGAGIGGSGSAEGFITSPRSARWLSPFAYRRQGFAVTETALLSRAGVLTHSLVIIPHERIQGIFLTQGPLNRPLGLTGIEFCTTDGPISPRVKQMSLETGRELFMSQASRAARARRLKDRDHWLEEENHE